MYFENFWIENLLVVGNCLFYKNVYECKLVQFVTCEKDPFYHLLSQNKTQYFSGIQLNTT